MGTTHVRVEIYGMRPFALGLSREVQERIIDARLNDEALKQLKALLKEEDQ